MLTTNPFMSRPEESNEHGISEGQDEIYGNLTGKKWREWSVRNREQYHCDIPEGKSKD